MSDSTLEEPKESQGSEETEVPEDLGGFDGSKEPEASDEHGDSSELQGTEDPAGSEEPDEPDEPEEPPESEESSDSDPSSEGQEESDGSAEPVGRAKGGELIADLIPGGRYEITGFLGSGGFAEVYEGFDAELQRPVAIKVMNSLAGSGSQKDGEVMLARFDREARTASAIDHTSVVTIYDTGVLEGSQPYIVMEKLVGHDFEEELEKNGAMSPRRVIPLFLKALDGLGVGHELGIIHKDLKPSNLFLVAPETEDEDIRVVDFGIARIGGTDENLTTAGQIAGTPRYIAPEYATTQMAVPATDVYQMALILVELLTGHPVVDNDNPLMCLMIHSKGDLNVSKNVLESALGAIITKALSHDPEQRYASATDFKKALEAIPLNFLPPSFSAPPERPSEQASPKAKAQDTKPPTSSGTGSKASETAVIIPDPAPPTSSTPDPPPAVKSAVETQHVSVPTPSKPVAADVAVEQKGMGVAIVGGGVLLIAIIVAAILAFNHFN